MLNARFWEFVNGDWVKLTLSPGQSLKWSAYIPDEEGYEYKEYYWIHKRHSIYNQQKIACRDCDGRLDRHYVYKCPITQLMGKQIDAGIFGDSRTEFEKQVRLPKWAELKSWQRDYYAEEMGY
jgi:hypothetical protein